MTRLFTAFLILSLPILCVAQKTSIENGKLNGILPVDGQGKVTYQIVKTVDSTSKEELFKRARQWFTKTYKSGKDVLQVSDVSTGELSGKGVFYINETFMGMTHAYPIS